MKLSPEQARKKLAALYRQHDEWQSEVLAAFEASIERIALKAIAALIRRLSQDLSFDARGDVEHTPQNLRTLGRIDKIFRELLEGYGYRKAVDRYLQAFPGQLPVLEKILDTIGQTLEKPFKFPETLLTKADRRALATQQVMTGRNLTDLAVTLGKAAKRKALFSVGGLDRESLTDVISGQLGKMRGEASSLMATSLAIWYRTASEKVFEKIQAAEKKLLTYVYDGPFDRLNRPFCRRLLEDERFAGKAWTRAEIDRMDNGQFPVGSVMVTNGGWNCRHQWRLSLPDEVSASGFSPKPIREAI